MEAAHALEPIVLALSALFAGVALVVLRSVFFRKRAMSIQTKDSWHTLCTSSNVGVRSIVSAPSGMILGGRIAGPRIVIFRSDNGGTNWSEQGVVTEVSEKESLGDVTLLLASATSLLCAFRIEGSGDFAWQVVVCQSNDLGKSWTFESVVDTSTGPFLGAPDLLLLGNEVLVVYDDEAAAQSAGYAGYQWLVLRRKTLGAAVWSSPTWVLDPAVITAISKHETVGLLRDGMASVVQLSAADSPHTGAADAKLLVVFESVDEAPPHRNLVHGMLSADGGRTWTESA